MPDGSHADELPDSGDPEADREAQRWAAGKAQRAVGDLRSV
jgi:hypothetical protein